MRVLIADDHSIIRMALKYVLREIDDAVEILEASTIAEAERSLPQHSVNLVIADLFMPGGGPTGIRRLVELAGSAPVVVFTVSESPAEVRACMAAGAKGFIPKTTNDPLVASILRLILLGGVYVPPFLTETGTDDGIEPEADTPTVGPKKPVQVHRLPPLTRRQRQVLELMAEGLSNADIAERLGLNLSTIKSHVTSVLRTLEVSSRTQAVLAFKGASSSSSMEPA